MGHMRAALLVHDTYPNVEPLVTPDQADRAVKDQTTIIRKAFLAARQRSKPVANAPADNGIADLSTELQETAGNLGMLAGVATGNSTVATVETPPVIPAPKRRRRAVQVQPIATIATALPPGPAPIKCEGCIHVDLLDMKVMTPAHIKHYLKSAGVLENAICAGECKEAIKNIFQDAPKHSLRYCDMTIKGFHAPETDSEKADMECGLFLCVPCYAKREVKYERLQSNDGGARRNSRRGKNKE